MMFLLCLRPFYGAQKLEARALVTPPTGRLVQSDSWWMVRSTILMLTYLVFSPADMSPARETEVEL